MDTQSVAEQAADSHLEQAIAQYEQYLEIAQVGAIASETEQELRVSRPVPLGLVLWS